MTVRDPIGLIVLVILVVGAVVGLSITISENRESTGSTTTGSSIDLSAVAPMMSVVTLAPMIAVVPSPVTADVVDAESLVPSSTMIPSSSSVPSDTISSVPSSILSDFPTQAPMETSVQTPFFEPFLPFLPTIRFKRDGPRRAIYEKSNENVDKNFAL